MCRPRLFVVFAGSGSLLSFLLSTPSVDGAPASLLLSRCESRPSPPGHRMTYISVYSREDSPKEGDKLGYLLAALLCLLVILVALFQRVVKSLMARLGLRWSACFRKPKKSSSHHRINSQVVTETPPYLSKETSIPFMQSATPSFIHPSSPSMPVITVTDSGANDLYNPETSLTLDSLYDAYIDRDRRSTQSILTKDSFPLSPRSVPETWSSELGNDVSSPGMSSQRSSDRLSVRSSLSPSSRLRVDTPSTNECSLSLDEFPRPPTLPSLPSPVLLSPTGLGKLSFSFPTRHCNGAYGASTPVLEIPSQGGPHALPGITYVRPLSYRDNLHRSSFAQASSVTLPLYPGRADGDYTGSYSTFPSCHNFVKALRGDHCNVPVPSPSSPPLGKLPF